MILDYEIGLPKRRKVPLENLFLFYLCLTCNINQVFAISMQQVVQQIRRRRHQPSLQLWSSATPIDSAGWPYKFPAKEHCSKCGLCETSFVSYVKEACAFLDEGMSRMDDMERQVHGRSRDRNSLVWSSADPFHKINGIAEEARFGVLHQPIMLAQGINISDAQWTGCVTGIALSMLEAGMVDAVVCIANEEHDKWSSPKPIIAKTPEDVLRGRGVKPALAPSLKVLDEIRTDKSIRKLLFCGVGCAVQGAYIKISNRYFLLQ